MLAGAQEVEVQSHAAWDVGTTGGDGRGTEFLRCVALSRAAFALWMLVIAWTASPAVPALARWLVLGYALLAALVLQAGRLRPDAERDAWFVWIDAAVLLVGLPMVLPAQPALASAALLPVAAAAVLQDRGHAAMLALVCLLGLLAQHPALQGAPDVHEWSLLAAPVLALVLLPLIGTQRVVSAGADRDLLWRRMRDGVPPRQGLASHVSVLGEALASHFHATRVVLVWPGPQPRAFELDVDTGAWREEAPADAWRTLRSAMQSSAGLIAVARRDGLSVERVAADLRRSPASEPGLVPPGLAGLMRPQAVTVPLLAYGAPDALLTVVRDGAAFSPADVGWVREVVEPVMALLERADLLEQMQRESATHERERIGRDLHDSAVQPYIGLKYGLEALARHAAPDNPLTPRLRELMHMTAQELDTLREVVSGLRRGESPLDGDSFSIALDRQVQRFTALYGLRIHVFAPDASTLRGWAAKAVLHMVNEALINIRRHTQARGVTLLLDARSEQVLITVRNDHGPHAGAQPLSPFVPRSLTERAAELGGRVDVRREHDHTEIQVTLPLIGAPR